MPPCPPDSWCPRGSSSRPPSRGFAWTRRWGTTGWCPPLSCSMHTGNPYRLLKSRGHSSARWRLSRRTGIRQRHRECTPGHRGSSNLHLNPGSSRLQKVDKSASARRWRWLWGCWWKCRWKCRWSSLAPRSYSRHTPRQSRRCCGCPLRRCRRRGSQPPRHRCTAAPAGTCSRLPHPADQPRRSLGTWSPGTWTNRIVSLGPLLQHPECSSKNCPRCPVPCADPSLRLPGRLFVHRPCGSRR
mmetsp:Transcript_25034/g.59536  ORF Transcript_25034/g.59536 Transcript_25034/m.59536 type:complete len:242 (-) Transcript_25034:1314-2039(-)